MAYHFENVEAGKGNVRPQSGRSFSQTLEELDPSEHYRGTSWKGMSTPSSASLSALTSM